MAKNGSDQRRAIFPAAYVANGGNGKEAAIAAGFAESGAKSTACRLLKEPEVLAAIKVLQDELLTKHSMTAETVMKQLAAIVHFDIRKLFDENGQMKNVRDLDDDTASALASIEVDDDYSGKGEERVALRTTKVKIFDKNTAITNAMKHYKLLTDGGITLNANLVQVISAEDAKLG